MGKRKPAFDPRQGNLFEVPSRPGNGASLAGLAEVFSSAVSQALQGQSRFAAAADVSELLDREVTKATLDAYCSEAKDGHNVPAFVLFALIASTGRYDVLDGLVQRIGGKLLVGEEVITAELGQVEALMRDLKRRHRELKSAAPVISRSGGAR